MTFWHYFPISRHICSNCGIFGNIIYIRLYRCLHLLTESGGDFFPVSAWISRSSDREIITSNTGAAAEHAVTVEKLHRLIPGAAVTAEVEQMVLGAPLTRAAIGTALGKKKEELDRLLNRLQLLDSHSAFYLLRHCLWLPRLQYLLRAAPVYQQPELLHQLDADLKSAVGGLVNVNFGEASWQQTVLPTSLGGLGLRRTADVALPSFISSLHRCQQLLSATLPPSHASIITEERDRSMADWLVMAGNKEPPDVESRSQQKVWDSPLAEGLRDSLLATANQFDRARLLSAATTESGAWLQALPAASLGTLLDNSTVRIAIALRVGADVCSEHLCKCGALADSKGYHSLTCRFSAGRHPRHTALNDIVKRALQSAGVPALLEPHGVDRGDGKRPDGMTLFPFSMGRCLVWDATCVNTYADSRLASATVKAGAAAGDAEAEKRRKYADLARRFRFEPVAFETSGSCGPSTAKLLREIGAQVSAVSGERRETEWLLQRCSIAVVRGNAASILLTRPSADEDSVWVPSESLTPANAPAAIPATATHQTTDEASPSWSAEPAACPPAVQPSVQPSRNPLDDPELARYLLPRAPHRPADTDALTSQEIVDQLLSITPSCSSTQIPGPPRPNALAEYAALLAVMREEEESHGQGASESP